MALTHEIESYLGRDALIEFAGRVFTMLRPGGVWINYDVVGPDDGDEPVLARFTSTDGVDIASPLVSVTEADLRAMSSASRFRQFAQDFRAAEGDRISFDEVEVDGETFVRLSRRSLYEFLAKKDYLASWHSEAHERFCFFSPDEWGSLLEHAGFRLTQASRPIRNPWLIENRFAPAAAAFTLRDGVLSPDEWSWTNVLLVAERPG